MGNKLITFFKMSRTKRTARKSVPLRPQRKPWLPNLRDQRPPKVESREHTDSDQEPSPSDTSESTKSQLNSSSESFLSKDSSDISPTISRPTLDSNPQLSFPSKKPLKPIWSDFSKTPTFAPSTPRELPSCQRICNSPEESEERDPELSFDFI